MMGHTGEQTCSLLSVENQTGRWVTDRDERMLKP